MNQWAFENPQMFIFIVLIAIGAFTTIMDSWAEAFRDRHKPKEEKEQK
ncbi:hypothetical protein [Paenibacillus tyrfis]|nr:hypothetical protein [Paenibacillus tyrfis]